MQQDMIRKKVEKMIKELAHVVKVSLMYGDKHRLMDEAVDDLYDILKELLSEIPADN